MTHLDSAAECEDCDARMTGMDSRDWAVDHVRDTGHLVKLRSLHQVEPEPTGWNAVAGDAQTQGCVMQLVRPLASSS
jgi:hypothetical protein